MRSKTTLFTSFNIPDRATAASLAVASAILLAGGLLLSTPGLVTVLGFVVIGLMGIMLTRIRCVFTSQQFSGILQTALELAGDREIYSRYRQLAEEMTLISQRKDTIYRQIALEQIDDVLRRTAIIAEGQFTYEGTEAWRIAYERLLRSPGLYLYRSVAWVRHVDYWQDEPGRKSLAVNFELLAEGGLTIERIAIIADEFWPAGELWPVEPLRHWLHEQHARGIEIKLVRQSALGKESGLLIDMGIYGSRALGIQELDAACRTIRFTLSFEAAHVAKAEERWDRLSVYAESFANYLDRYELP
jgi:hypothetical protein